MKVLKQLVGFIHGYWKETILTWVSVFFEVVTEVLITFVMQFLINCMQDTSSFDMNGIIRYTIIIACLALVSLGTGIAAGIFASVAASGFGKNIREAMYVKIQDFSFRNIDKFSISSIVTRTTTDVTNVQNAFMQIIRAVIRAPFMMIFSLTMCFITEARVAWIFLIIIPILLFALFYIAIKTHPIFVKVFETYDDLNQIVEENVDGVRAVKSFERGPEQIKKFNGISDFIYRNFIKAEKKLAFNNPIMNFCIFGAEIAISWIGSIIFLDPNNTTFKVGTLSTLLTYIMMILFSLMMISMVYVMITIARNSAERIIAIIDEVPDIQNPENPVMEVKDGQVDFDGVSFAYTNEKNVLEDINVHVKAGSSVGIIGPTGSSKTTLISLIARLYDVDKGDVKVGGIDVRNYDLKVLRDSVAVVLQKNTLFTGTIRSNLLWGNENATEEEIWKACDIAQASEFINRFNDKLDSPIDQGGTNVSGGQKQRLCIARALLKNPKILILDDSTSACDTHTDALIREELSKKKDVTKFIIAQRVLSIRDCDQIIVMDNGHITAIGNNDELMQSCPVYKELYESQLGGGDFDAAN